MAEDAQLCKKVEDEFVRDREVQVTNQQDQYEQLLNHLIPIASPLANYKLCKSICRLIRKATKIKKCSRGVKATNKSIRKCVKGIVILAGDTTPMDTISHFPIWCESLQAPYIYVPSSVMISNAMQVIGHTACLMIQFDDSYQSKYDKIVGKISRMPFPISLE